MMRRTAGILLVLLLTGCNLPTQPARPTATTTAACPAGGCPTDTLPPTPIFPQTPFTPAPTDTATPSANETVVVETPTEQTVESETPEPIPTGLAELTSTPTPYLSPTPGPSPTRTPIVSDKLYILQDGTPRFIQNFAQTGKGCNWMGVAGQVFGAGGAPMKNLVVVVTGELDGQLVDAVALTGLATAYGAGGYEVELGSKALKSEQALTIQLFDLAGGELSDPYLFDTSASCSENLIVINFVPNT